MTFEMPKESKDEKMQREARERFLTYDQAAFLALLGLNHDDDNIYMTFLKEDYRVERATGLVWKKKNGEEIPADTDEMASLFEMMCASSIAPMETGTWKSIAALCTNTTDTSLTRYDERLRPFTGKMDLLAAACEKLGGEKKTVGDTSYSIEFLPGLHVWFQCWDADDEYPLSVQFLFDESIVFHYRWSILWNVMSCVTKRLLEEAGL